MSDHDETGAEPHRHRPDDHLLEPFFGGLGVDGKSPHPVDDVPPSTGLRSLLRRFLTLFSRA